MSASSILPYMERPPFDFAEENYPLAPVSLYNVGGPARWALLPRNRDEVEAAYRWLRDQNAPRIVLGGGSNVLIADEGFPGVVVFTHELNRTEALGDDRYTIEGGVELGAVVRDVMLTHNYVGVGGLTGIPGSVGGAIYMNAGTVNGSICELMESVDIVTEQGTETIPMSPDLYGYRGQTFCPSSGFILGGIFRFAKSDEGQRAIYEHYMERRKRTQPKGFSCGSVFKNPPDNHAGQLIESCGLKGMRRGGASISDMHANFIVNDQGATSGDILELISLCKETVRERFQIELETEVKIFGVEPAR